MALSDLATRLLSIHAAQPTQLFYATDALGPMFRDADVSRLDDAYRELEEAKLMGPAGPIISYFGAPKRIYKITDLGQQSAKQRVA